MCGIVGYFGGAGNNLTRVLTGMSAIIYRAPDSTGVAIFGDDGEPIKTRKAVGSVERLAEALLEDCAYPNFENVLLSVCSNGDTQESLLAQQRRLIAFEGLPVDQMAAAADSGSYPTYDDLVDLNTDGPCRLTPGQPGRPNGSRPYFLRSKKDVGLFVRLLIEVYDLSPVVIREIIRKPLLAVIAAKRAADAISAESVEIMNAFDRLFESILEGQQPLKVEPGGRKRFPPNPLALKSLWRCLPDTPIHIPRDYDRDGVCCMFRLLDVALLTRLAYRPKLLETLERTLVYSWPRHQRPAPMDWKSLYRAEKGVNVYGWAAAAALTCLQRDDFLPEILGDLSGGQVMRESSIVPGQTDPLSLRYLTQPVISHGRWAVQSAVNEKNAHPFLDEKRYRSVVINGQFDGKTEDNLKKFIAKVGDFSFRSENSAEYFPLLWGYYFEQLSEAQKRYRAVLTQVRNDLQEYGIGSNTIDYSVHQAVKDKTPVQLDEAAFIEAARQITKHGGQVAACGMSILSPRKLYVAAHNRPVFVVRRLENDDFMVVSDINAAMGLFPQKLIFEKREELERLEAEFKAALDARMQDGAGTGPSTAQKAAFTRDRAKLLKAFSVEVHALDGEEIFARIETRVADGRVSRVIGIFDFNGNPLPDIEPFRTVLSPIQAKKDRERSFYETHLREIPDRFADILRTYVPQENRAPVFDIRKNRLRRRFGADFRSLKRIFLAGTGSAYFMCEIGKRLFNDLMPGVDVRVVRPGEIEKPESMFVPEKDLVVLLSWSSTTADMVLLAKKLLSMKVVMVCITEKTFADMAIIVAKSGGVIHCLSQEEVTVAGVKSTICMLFCLYLLGMWIAAGSGDKENALAHLGKMHRLPHILANLLRDEKTEAFTKALAAEKAQSIATIVIGAVNTDGVGREAALKMEESSWTSLGKALDYRDVLTTGFAETGANILVIVDATCRHRHAEAVAVMERLRRRHVEFVALGLSGQAEAHVKRLSEGRCFFLPHLEKEALQPFVSLIFFYQLSFYYGLAHGIGLGVAPRNRAKSMTIGRSLFEKKDSSAKELFRIKNLNEKLRADNLPAPGLETVSIWEKDAHTPTSRHYYRQMRHLARMMSTRDLQAIVCGGAEENAGRLAAFLFDDNSDIDEIILAPMERAAEAAVRSVAAIWSRLWDYPLRVVSPEQPLDAFERNVLLFMVAATSAGQTRMAERLARASCPVFRLAVEGGSDECPPVENEGGVFLLKEVPTEARSDYLFAAVNLIFIEAWRRFYPSKAQIVEAHFRSGGQTVLELLNNAELKAGLEKCVSANRQYETLFYIGPPVGTGLAWVEKFDRTGARLMESHVFGESAHGPIVTVDSRVERKFVKLDSRKQMVSAYGEERVSFWEKRYLGGRSVDAFLNAPPVELFHEEKTPFFVDGAWYLPTLQDDYDRANDNLIVMDACWEPYIDQTLDEISAFGCRYPRMVLMTQQSFLNSETKDALYKFPVSNTITLPETPVGPVAKMHLPLIMNIIGEELAACAKSHSTAKH